ncbi:unnamed protein product [Somion occarium]|uniref:Uncharacterized protein n=1 Tax=Somion occarium TaxID=3059160 RepID=A0ABP1DHZ7_9APHY
MGAYRGRDEESTRLINCEKMRYKFVEWIMTLLELCNQMLIIGTTHIGEFLGVSMTGPEDEEVNVLCRPSDVRREA